MANEQADAFGQAVGEAINSVRALATETADIVATLYETRTIGRSVATVTGPAIGNSTYVFAQPVDLSGQISLLRAFVVTAPVTIKVKRFTRSGDDFTQVASYDVALALGENNLGPDVLGEIPVQAGEYLGLYGRDGGTGRVAVTSAASDSGGYYNSTGDVSSFTDSSVTSTTRIEIGFDIESPPVTAERIVALEEETASNTARVAELFDTQIIGISDTPVVGSGVGGRTYVLTTPLDASGVMQTITAYSVIAGTVQVKRFTRSGNDFTQVGTDYPVTVASGVNFLTEADFGEIPVSAGEYLGFYGSGLISFVSATNPGYYDSGSSSGNVSSFTDSATTTTNELQIGFGVPALVIDAERMNDIESRLTVLEESGAAASERYLGAASRITLANWNHVIGYGQSNDIARAALPILTTVDSIRHLMFNVGVSMTKPGLSGAHNPDDLAPLRPLVSEVLNSDGGGDCGETLFPTACKMASRLVTETMGVSPVFIASAAGKGGAGFDTIGYNTAWYANLRYQWQRGYALATADDKTYTVVSVDFDHGEADQGDGVSKADCTTALNALIDGVAVDMAADLERTVQPQWLCTVSPYKITVSAGHTEAVLEACEPVSAGGRADCHLVAPGYRFPQGDNDTHLANVGQALKGAYYGRAEAQLIQGRVPDRVRWLGAVADGTSLAAWAEAPTALAINTVIIGAATNSGIKVADDTGTLTLSAITCGTAILDPVTGLYRTPVTMTLNRTLGANPYFRYARDFLGAGLVITNGASGNLFDTTTDTVEIDGNTYSMAHPAPPCALSIFIDEA